MLGSLITCLMKLTERRVVFIIMTVLTQVYAWMHGQSRLILLKHVLGKRDQACMEPVGAGDSFV